MRILPYIIGITLISLIISFSIALYGAHGPLGLLPPSIFSVITILFCLRYIDFKEEINNGKCE